MDLIKGKLISSYPILNRVSRRVQRVNPKIITRENPQFQKSNRNNHHNDRLKEIQK